VLNNIRIDKKFWINFVCFVLGGILLIYMYSKYRIAPDIKFSELELKSKSGQSIHISDYKGKVVFINFWQTWCGPCRQEMSSIESAKESLDSSKIVFFTVTDEDENKIESFTDGKNFQFDFLKCTKTLKELGVNTYPTTYILDPDGKIVFTKIGGVVWNDPQNLNLMKNMMR
jgi:thiol-disulfide isomerase/thioredoxin